jgi:hypothetical protein
MRPAVAALAVAVAAAGVFAARPGAADAATHGKVLASLSDPGGTPFDDFSISAVSVNGNTAVVGADGTNFAHGAAYVYVKGTAGWPTSPTVTLQDPGPDNSDIFAISVSVRGTVIVVGAYGTSSGAGAAYIYVKGRRGWPTTPTVSLADPAATAGDEFGSSVAVTSGNTVLVGAEGTNTGAGAAYLYVKGPTGWPTSPTATLADPAATSFDLFGASVALEGDTAVVGAYNGNAAYIYVRGTGGWPTTPTVSLADPAATSGDLFGSAVATTKGTTVVGAPFTSPGGDVYVYTRGVTGWPATPTASLPDPGGGFDDFGVSVAVAGHEDGQTILAGSDNANSAAGAVYTYITGDASPWPTTPTATLTDPAATPGTDFFGESVAVGGTTAVGGAWGTLGDIGAAYIFVP